jgi:hypothetical protein
VMQQLPGFSRASASHRLSDSATNEWLASLIPTSHPVASQPAPSQQPHSTFIHLSLSCPHQAAAVRKAACSHISFHNAVTRGEHVASVFSALRLPASSQRQLRCRARL